MSVKRWRLLWGLCAMGLLYFGLRFENEIARVCPVCASELVWRQRGLALSEDRKFWAWSASEVVIDSGVSRDFLTPGHEHTWQTWSNLYIALNGRSGGHPFVRWNPAARAWRYNEKFSPAVREFAAVNPGNMAVAREMFLLPDFPEGQFLDRKDIATTVEKCRVIFEESGEVVPRGWQRLVSR